ncbi:hypothetical protein [Desulfovibrio ferrophilus]|uniref:Uncharacterized protein n=1 Tax=Desulfovibrio ferrophilus TaxID=241368 RepID=A0A2Z6AZX2_9BACT|nr:hypothetical protein [Desulfovibrio ferrophilus]BBD08750.1 uncharacterized protein DFE_2024 [Desulfovibrio ferrophilus]
MYNHILKVHDQYLAKDMALPQNASQAGNGETLNFSGSLGGVEVLAEVTGDIALADTKTLTVGLEHSDSGQSWEPLGEVCKLTASGPLSIEAGTVLGRFIPPTDTKALTRAVITTDDAAASGFLSIYPHYLAR